MLHQRHWVCKHAARDRKFHSGRLLYPHAPRANGLESLDALYREIQGHWSTVMWTACAVPHAVYQFCVNNELTCD